MTTLLRAACEVLEDISSAAAMKAAAAEALLVAMQLGVEMPARAVWLVWLWMKGLPSNRSWPAAEKLGAISDARVRADALGILDGNDGGDDLLGLATDILSGTGHAAHIDDAALIRCLDRARSDDRVRQLGELLVSVHRAREISSSLLRSVRDRWMASSSPVVREAAVTIASELTEPDFDFVARMLEDPNADVRMAVADRIARGLLGGSQSLGLIESRIRVEGHEETRSALLHSQAALVARGATPRRRR